ncbi:MAG: FAD-dependent oxidoreductase [Firmicutes bacterium]|nr:FAD-dependent oxidoreductase [Bacillota bacterium]
MGKIIIAGGGWAGCAAAIRARKLGNDVTLIEKTDMLLGLGNVGGIMRNNGRFTAAEENIAMGAGELFEITDRLSTHRNVDFPGHSHASFYNVQMVEPEVRRLLAGLGVNLRFMCRAVDVVMDEERRIKALEVLTYDGHGSYEKEILEGDVFVETTGSTGPMGNCTKYGNGCSMCVLRCPAFGPRVSLSEKAGNPDMSGQRPDGSPGALSGSCKLEKGTLSAELRNRIERDGFAVIPLPAHLVNHGKLSQKVCQQYALPEFAENVILIDTGHAKLMTSYFNLEQLRTIPGLENARFADPYAGGKGNSVRYMSVGERDGFMRARGIPNLFLGGEKSGFFVGHTEAITTGSLAGYNAARLAAGKPLLRLPETMACGDLLSYAQAQLGDLSKRFTFAGGEYFERMKTVGLYTTDVDETVRRVTRAGLSDIYGCL